MTQGDLAALLPFVLIALVFWFLIFRPARKRQRETTQTQSSLEVGVRVMLTSGIFGEVISVGDSEVEVEVAPDTVLTVHRQAIGRVVPAEDPADEGPDSSDDSEYEEDSDEFEDDATITATDETYDSDDNNALPPTHQENK